MRVGRQFREFLSSNVSLSMEGVAELGQKFKQLKEVLDETQKNRINLYRKSLAFALMYDDESYRIEELSKSKVNHQYKFYYPFTDSVQFWTVEKDFCLPETAKLNPNFSVDIGFSIFHSEIYKTESYLRSWISPDLSNYLDNMSESEFKSLIVRFQKSDVLSTIASIFTHAFLKVYSARLGNTNIYLRIRLHRLLRFHVRA